MNRSLLLIAMAMMTGLGIALFGFGMVDLTQFPGQGFAQSWDQLWRYHSLFAWVATLYGCAMVFCDLWVVFSILFIVPQKKPTRH